MSTSESLKGTAIPLAAAVQYADGSVVSKTLLDKKAGTLTLFAFDAGQGLSEHTAPYDATVQILDGEGELTIMPANVPHDVRAEQRFKMLLIMIRS